MILETVKLSDIHPYEFNAKNHPQSQIDMIIKSIQQFGNRDPIAIDENGTVIEGHGRLLALQQLGYTETEVIRLTGMTADQKRAYILVHNQLTLNTGFDMEKLEEEISKIETVDLSDFDLTLDADFDYMESAADDPLQGEADDSSDLIHFALVLDEAQYQELTQATDFLKSSGIEPHGFGNPNKRNNYIFEVVYQWAEQKKLL